MSETDESLPAEVDVPLDEPAPDVAEEYAEQVGVDPTHDEVDRYLEIAGEAPLTGAAPAGEPLTGAGDPLDAAADGTPGPAGPSGPMTAEQPLDDVSTE
jgi:hypothetical protein